MSLTHKQIINLMSHLVNNSKIHNFVYQYQKKLTIAECNLKYSKKIIKIIIPSQLEEDD